MNSKVEARLAQQWGLITRAQALEAGMRPDQIDRMVRTRVWTPVRRGVYARRAFLEQLSTERDRQLVAARAVSLGIGRPHVLSHHSAAYVLGIDVLHAKPPISHVTRPGIVGTHVRHGVKHHRAPYSSRDRIEIAGLAVLAGARTALDITRELGFRHGIVAADSALRTGTTTADLRRVREEMRCWPQATVLDDVIASASADSDSVGETLTRVLVTSLGFGVPVVQLGLTADGQTVWCDLSLGRHVFEFDGRMKYRRVEDGGVSSLDPGETLWREKKRQDFISSLRLGVSRVVWDDLMERNWDHTKARLRREYKQTCRLFGTDTGDLEALRARGARPRPTIPLVTWPGAA